MTRLDDTVQRLGDRFGLTDGQVYSAVIGLAVASGMALLAVPPVLNYDRVLSASAAVPIAGAPLGNPAAAVAQPLTPAPVVVVPVPAGPAFPLGPPLLSMPSAGSQGPAAPFWPPAVVDAPPAWPSVQPQPAGVAFSVARVPAPGAPAGITVTSGGRVFVSTNNGTSRGVRAASAVFEVSTKGQLRKIVTVAGQPAAHPDGIVALAALPTGGLLAVDASTSRVLRIEPSSGAQSVVTTIPDLPSCFTTFLAPPCEQGSMDRKPQLTGLAIDPSGNAYITDSGQGVVWRLPSGAAQPTLFYAPADLATGDGPAGIGFDSQRNLLLTVGQTFDTTNIGNGGLYRLAVSADGAAGARTLVTSFASNDRPGALVEGKSGNTYVVLRGTAEIVTVDPAGKRGSALHPSTSSVKLDAPGGLALADGVLLATNQGTGQSGSNWAVVTFPVMDSPAA